MEGARRVREQLSGIDYDFKDEQLVAILAGLRLQRPGCYTALCRFAFVSTGTYTRDDADIAGLGSDYYVQQVGPGYFNLSIRVTDAMAEGVSRLTNHAYREADMVKAVLGLAFFLTEHFNLQIVQTELGYQCDHVLEALLDAPEPPDTPPNATRPVILVN